LQLQILWLEYYILFPKDFNNLSITNCRGSSGIQCLESGTVIPVAFDASDFKGYMQSFLEYPHPKLDKRHHQEKYRSCNFGFGNFKSIEERYPNLDTTQEYSEENVRQIVH